MKKMRDYVFALGASAVLALGVVLAQDQAPTPAAPQPPPVHQPQTAPAAGPAPAPAKAAATTAPTQPTPRNGAHRTLSNRRASAVPGIPSSVRPSAEPEASAASADGAADTSEPKTKTTTPALKFDNAPADMLVSAYCEQTDKTPLWAPDAPKVSITLKSQPNVKLTKEDFIEAIETVLSMNGIVLEPFGDKFIKVLARKTVRTDGIKIVMDLPEKGHPEKTRVVSQMIQLKSITVAEAQKALEGFKHADGQFQTFERTNSILVTDTQENVNRMLEIVKFIDQPLVATEEVNVRVIHFAKAEDIKKRIEELVAESQKAAAAKDEIKANASGSPGITRTAGTVGSSLFSTRPLPPGLTRLGAQPPPAATTPNETLETLVSDADRGMIRGKVQIIADERTNQLIIITRADNMAFFDRIITILDIETAPDTKVEVQRLEFANAEDVSTMLNDLIGNATAKKDDKSPSKGAAKTAGTPGSTSGSASAEPASRSTSLAEAVAARATRNESVVSDSTKSKLGQLSKENIKILADKRTNAIIMMGSIGDLAAIKEIVKDMDIQLSQVLIETVVIQVELGKDLATGLDWVAGTAPNPKTKQPYTLNNTDQLAGGGGSGSTLLQSLTGIATNSSVVSSGVNYFLKSDKLNISALISASQSDNRTKVLSSPVLLTVDNKEATIEATSMRYLYKGVRTSGTSSYGYTEVPDYEQRDIGLTVKVTPRISPNGMVILTIDEKFETIGANQEVGTGEQKASYPTVNTRKIAADVSVNNMQTVVLGGLVQNETKTDTAGIPVLKDIPWVGKYLFGSTSTSETRSELLVFLTPYVLKTAEEAEAEAQRRKDALHDDKPWSDGGWSKSKLADPVSEKDKLDRARLKWASEDAERDAQKTNEKLFRVRKETMLKMAQQDAVDAEKNEKADKALSAGPSVGRMNVTESVEVIRPKSASEPAPAVEAPAPVAPEPEQPKKSWWRLF